MKKYLSAFAASCILSITFCGCGNNSSNTASSKTPAATTIGTVSDSIENPETDMFADIIPDYFEIYHGGGGDIYDILYHSISD